MKITKKVTKKISFAIMAGIIGIMGSIKPIRAEEPDTEYDLKRVYHSQDVHFYLGDINEDGKVTMEEAYKVLNYALHIEKETNTLEAFLADYDGNTRIELGDAKSVLETALKIKSRKEANVLDRGPETAYICDDEGGKLKPSMEWLDSEEKIMEYMQPYESQWYKRELSTYIDFVEFRDEEDKAVLCTAEQDGNDTESMQDRGIIVGRVELQESDLYQCMWILNNNNYFLYVIGIDSVENGSKKVFSTFCVLGISPKGKEMKLSSMAVNVG